MKNDELEKEIEREYQVKIRRECLSCKTFLDSHSYKLLYKTCFVKASRGLNNMRYEPCPCFECIVKPMCGHSCLDWINKWMKASTSLKKER